MSILILCAVMFTLMFLGAEIFLSSLRERLPGLACWAALDPWRDGPGDLQTNLERKRAAGAACRGVEPGRADDVAAGPRARRRRQRADAAAGRAFLPAGQRVP